jgi:multidrug resistance efflux pump
MTNGNTHAINKHLDEREDYDALQEVTAELEQAEARIEELEAKLAKAEEVLRLYAEGEWAEDYPGGVLYAAGDDTSEFKTHLDYGDLARTTIAELKGETDE